MRDLLRFKTWLQDLIDRGNQIPEDPDARGMMDGAAFIAWEVQVEHFLIELVGAEGTYNRRFQEAINGRARPDYLRRTGVAILTALAEDLENGRLLSLRAIVAAEMFADFLDMADHLLENGYKDASAALIGATLERGLRDIATANDVEFQRRDDLSVLSNRLLAKNVINQITLRNLNVWIAVRNSADHGRFDDYTLDAVVQMKAGVQAFLGSFNV